MARPNVYTNEQIIAALVECKGLVFLAAKRVGCDPDTIYNRAKRSEAVARAIKNQRGEIIDTAELKLYQAILNGEHWAVAMTLKCLAKDRGYVERVETKDVTPTDLEIVENIVEGSNGSAQAAAGGQPPPDAAAVPPEPGS